MDVYIKNGMEKNDFGTMGVYGPGVRANHGVSFDIGNLDVCI